MKTSSPRIEALAVNALKGVLLKSPLVIPRISENDRTPSTDGFLEVYTDESAKKDHLAGNIAVQVKGYTRRLRSLDHVKYDVSVADLKNFEAVHHGAIFFVVALDSQGELRQVFYKQFLPFDVETTIRGLSRPEQESVRVRLRPFPDDRRSIDRICSEFLRDKENQGSTILVDGAITPADLEKRGIVVGSYSWTKTLYADESDMSLAPYENGVYMYAVDSNTGLKYAVGWYEAVEKIQRIKRHVISAGDVSVSVDVGVSGDSASFQLEFGCFSITCGEHQRVDYKERGGFRQRLENSMLLRALVESEELRIDGDVLISGLMDVNVDRSSLDERISIHRAYSKAEDLLHSRVDFDPDELAEEDLWSLSRLVEALVFNRPYKSSSDISLVSNIDIGDKRVKVVCQPIDDGTYQLSDLLCGQYAFSFGYPPEGDNNGAEMAPLPTLLSLSEDDYSRVINIDSERFAADLESRPLSAEISDPATQKLLEMLKAWDAGAVCSDDLIQCCTCLAEALDNVSKSDESAINKLQVSKRIGALEPGDNEELMRILVNTSSTKVKAACYLLLERHSDAERCISQLSGDEKTEFESWPITRFRNVDKSS